MIPRLGIVLVVAATYLPFLHQAFHIDDRIYLQVADQILDNPLFPYDFDALYEGFVAPDAASHSHLPLTSYYIAALQLLSGDQSEWILHLAFLIFPILAALSFYELAGHFVTFPGIAAALLTSSTSFMVLSHTIMPDVALLSLWLVAMAAFFRLIDQPESRWSPIVCYAAILGAAFMSLLTVALLLLLVSYALLQQRRSSIDWKRVLTMAGLPLLLWFLWYLRAYLHYERMVLVNTVLHMEQRAAFDWSLIGTKSLSFLLHLGGTFLFPVAIWAGLAGKKTYKWSLVFFFLVFIPVYGWKPDWQWLQVFLFAVFVTTGALALGRLLWTAVVLAKASLAGKVLSARELFWGAKEDAGAPWCAEKVWVLFLWLGGILFSCALVFYSGSARYPLLGLPPFLLLWQMALESRPGLRARGALVLLPCLLVTLPYSLAVAVADYGFANSYRLESNRLAGELKDRNATVWYTGEWGFRYYMEQIGARALTKVGTGPRAGDLIVKPYVALPWVTLYDSQQYSQHVEERPFQARYPLRILDFHSEAGFYSTAWGILPFSWSTNPRWEWLNVYEVKKQYDGPVPEIERPW